MSKQLVEEVIFLNSQDEIYQVLKTFKESQKISFICPTCGGTALKTVGSFKKKKTWECKSCSAKRASILGKMDLESSKSKRRQTMISRGYWFNDNLNLNKDLESPKKLGTPKRRRKSSESKETRSLAARKSVDKRNQTILNKYGSLENYNKVMLEKRKATCILRYGVDNPAKLEDTKNKMRNTNYAKFGTINPAQNHDVISKTRKKYFFNGIHFDSSWELAYYIYLTDNNYNFIFHPKIKFLYTFENKKHYYFPDFIVNGEITEIKNLALFRKMLIPNTIDNAKYYCMLENNVKILLEDDIKFYLEYVSINYGKTFLQKWRNKKANNS